MRYSAQLLPCIVKNMKTQTLALMGRGRGQSVTETMLRAKQIQICWEPQAQCGNPERKWQYSWCQRYKQSQRENNLGDGLLKYLCRQGLRTKVSKLHRMLLTSWELFWFYSNDTVLLWHCYTLEEAPRLLLEGAPGQTERQRWVCCRTACW